MRKHKNIGIFCLLLISLLTQSKSEGNFEDADKLNEFMSGSTNQYFDLRHTIPGEPEVDYPIYSAVPKTSFECTGKHEGYYADMESRCQAFRICTHTARSVQGFGFLCPNGTLFSQKNFVCDWYRNVNCEDSEQFFSKNDINRIGSKYDMMETVRQMMEYPMKTISKALQQPSSTVRRPSHRQKNISKETTVTNQKSASNNSPVQANTAKKTAVTRAQIESAYDYTNTQEKEEKKIDLHENIKSDSITITNKDDDKDDVYVNSLGELSTDPGVNFDRTNAHIIAEVSSRSHKLKKMNFAEKVNAGLNDLVELPNNDVLAPDYVKTIRHSKEEATQTDLASNINGLLDEIATDLDPAISGYQIHTPAKSKQSFRFLSRGFSSQSSGRDSPYVYGKPKQTASTIRFSPNELPLDTHKNTNTKSEHKFDIIDDEAIQFSFLTTTTETPAIDESFLTAPTLPPRLEDNNVEAVSAAYEHIEQSFENAFNENETVTTSSPPSQEQNIATTENASNTDYSAPFNLENDKRVSESNASQSEENLAQISKYLEAPIFTVLDTSTELPHNDIDNIISAITQNIDQVTEREKTVDLTTDIEPEDLVIDEEKSDVNQHAANLLLAGVKLTTLGDNVGHNLEELQTPTSETSTTSELTTDSLLTDLVSIALNSNNSEIIFNPTTAPVTMSVETITEINTTQERIRGYRRFATLQRSKAKPLVYTKRTPLPSLSTPTKTTTTAKPLTSTVSYLKRVAASRLRLSRLNATKNTINSTTTISPIESASDTETNKKLSVRNLDRETATINDIGGEKKTTYRGAATWDSVRNNLQQYQVQRNRSGNNGYTYSTTQPTTTTVTASESVRSAILSRNRNRFTNFKTQTSRNNQRKTTNPKAQRQRQQQQLEHKETESDTATLNNIPTSLASSVNIFPSHNTFNNPSSISNTPTITINSSSSPSNIQTQTDTQTPFSNSLSTINSKTAEGNAPSSTFLSFDKVTRAIVDDSILQNFRSNQATNRATTYQAASPKIDFGATGTPSKSAVFNTVGYPKVPAQAPSQLIPSQRPQHLAKIQSASSSQTAVTAVTPRIVIARAEGQRIEPNSVSAIISSLTTQQKPKASHATSYVALNDFLTKKFGNNAPTVTATSTLHQPQSLPKAPTTAATFAAATQQPTREQLQQLNFITQQYQQQYETNKVTQQQVQQNQHQQQPQQLHEQQHQHQQHYQQQQYQQLAIPTVQTQYFQQQQQSLRPTTTQQTQNVYLQQIQHFQPQQIQQTPTSNGIRPQQNVFSSQLQHQQTQLPNINYQQQQQQTQQPITAQTIQQPPFNTQNIFASYKHQQQQLPQFPPLAPTPNQIQQETETVFGNSQVVTSGNDPHLNVQLPALPNGLIPAPNTPTQDSHLNVQLPALANGLIPTPNSPATAQKRIDSISPGVLELTTSTGRVFSNGASSYEVPLKSIGRLPNDITHLLRRLRKY